METRVDVPLNPSIELLNLPYDVLERILLDMDSRDIESFCLVNKEVLNICRDNLFWILKLNHDFEVGSMKPSEYMKLFEPSYLSGRSSYYNFKNNVVQGTHQLDFAIVTYNVNQLSWLLKYYQQGGRNIQNLSTDPTTGLYTYLGSAYPSLDVLRTLSQYNIFPRIDGIKAIINTGDINKLEFLHQSNVIPGNIMQLIPTPGSKAIQFSIPWLRAHGY